MQECLEPTLMIRHNQIFLLHCLIQLGLTYFFQLQKQEPMEEDRNDSGINSGSDFQSSSPGSENSQDFNNAAAYSAAHGVGAQNHPYYSTPLVHRASAYNQPHAFGSLPPHLGFNPLTPPNSEPMVSPNTAVKTENDSTR